MMKHEFEELAGYEVTWDDYNNIIEPMYMAVNMDKADFVKVISKERFALPTKEQMIRQMRKIAKHIYEHCGERCFYDEEQELEKLVRAYVRRFHGLNLDDIHDWYWIVTDKGYCGHRFSWGCSFPAKVQIGRGSGFLAEIILVK